MRIRTPGGAHGENGARSHALPHSRIRLQLSAMASFRPDGVLSEGHGVVPDVSVRRSPAI